MASSNRHWPSMFKSKPCNPHHQWQHDVSPSSLLSTACHRSPYTSVPGSEERSPEPKPRWNPKPEQIRILEAIFNSGMVNPPRDEIRKIRAQLQEFGQVGDANVFYWFQNRKSRSKHKLRHLQNSSKQQNNQITPPPPVINNTTASTTALPAPSSSSSSSSEKCSPCEGSKGTAPSFTSTTANIHLSTSPTASVTQPYFQPHTITEFLPEPFFFSAQHTGTGGNITQGFCFPELSNVVQVQDHPDDHDIGSGPCTGLLLSEIINSTASKKDNQGEMKAMKMQQAPPTNYTAPSATSLAHTLGLAPPPPSPHATNNNSVTVTSAINHIHQGN